MGKALLATHAARGPVTGWTRDSSDVLASLFLQKGSLTLWQPVNLPGLF